MASRIVWAGILITTEHPEATPDAQRLQGKTHFIATETVCKTSN